MASVQFADMQFRPVEFLDVTSLTLDEFHQLVPPFEAAFQAHMARVTPTARQMPRKEIRSTSKRSMRPRLSSAMRYCSQHWTNWRPQSWQ